MSTAVVEYEDDEDSLVLRLLRAATDNDPGTLKQLLDSPEWYNVRDESGNSLLHIAVSRRNYEVFDYLLSLDDFPLDSINDEGDTALDVVLTHLALFSKEVYERYAVALIKKDANASYRERPLLHFAAFYGLPRMARLLIERGADLNEFDDDGSTPLHISVANITDTGSREIVTMLLCYGADPSVLDENNCTAFNLAFNIIFEEKLFDFKSDIYVALENLFLFTFDKSSSFQFLLLLNLAYVKSPLFYEVIKFDCEILFENSLEDFDYWVGLFCIDFEYLHILLEKYPNTVKHFLDCSKLINHSHSLLSIPGIDVKKVDMLIQNSVCSDSCIELFSKLSESGLVIDQECIFALLVKYEDIIEIIYYLLSYGIILNEPDLDYIYDLTGYSEDFKIFLHMDFQNKCRHFTDMMPSLLYGVTLDIHKIVENPSLCELINNWKEIFHYFVHPKIQKAYRQLKPDEASERELPRLPLLQELARDAFRKYFIKRYEITSARKFYTILKVLRTKHKMFTINFEKIVTFEKKLYYFES